MALIIQPAIHWVVPYQPKAVPTSTGPSLPRAPERVVAAIALTEVMAGSMVIFAPATVVQPLVKNGAMAIKAVATVCGNRTKT